MKEQIIAGAKAKAVHGSWYSRAFAHFAQHPGSQRGAFVPNFLRNALFPMRRRIRFTLIPILAAISGVCVAQPVRAAPTTPSSRPPVSDAASYAAGVNSVKAHELVAAAINMTDSERAVKLLWQATELDPTL